MTEVSVTVYLNEGRNRFWKYEPGDQLDQVLAIEMDLPVDRNVLTLLEILFEQLNVDEPRAEWAKEYRRRRNRSLSVGDVVVLGETAWACQSVGWVQVRLPARLGVLDVELDAPDGQ